ncbi:MAG TPA: PIG-L deacetylase family protein [Pseudonocardiaceae bacterium]|nr:PIG-L deacetylase family protein [Pseudonocardiaceae bacterium]
MTGADRTRLAPFPEDDWSSGLAVVAHPDDIEFGGAGAVARWTAQGKRITYLLASRGEAGINGLEPEACAEIRMAEQFDSAAEVGVGSVEFLAYRDGLIEYGLPLRRDIAEVIRRYRPEMIFVVNHRERYSHGMLNMADHRAVGQAAIDAVRDAANPWLFPEIGQTRARTWDGVRHLAVLGSSLATHAVDITDTFDAGLRSLQHHAVYLKALGPEWPAPEILLRERATAVAERFGGRLGVAFEMLRSI